MTKVTCGWCNNEFDMETEKDKRGYYGQKRCPKCSRFVRSSKVESTGNTITNLHIHSNLKTGDVV